MPAISMFFGIVIRMYWEDHRPPHFHAYYQDMSTVYDLEGNLLEGTFPKKQSSLATAWANIHHDELVANWVLTEQRDAVFRIEPLR